KNQGGTTSTGRLISKAAVPAPVAQPKKQPDEVREIAVFWGNGTPVSTVAFSTDGARLAIVRPSGSAGAEQNPATLAREAVVWDVASQKSICTCINPKIFFTSAWFSANGKTLVTVANGRFGVGIAGDGAYQAWDAQSGREIGSAIVP